MKSLASADNGFNSKMVKSFFRELKNEGIVADHFNLIGSKKKNLNEVAKKVATVIFASIYNLQENEFLQHVNYNLFSEGGRVLSGFDKIDPEINSENFPAPVNEKGREDLIMKLVKGSAKFLTDFKVETGYRFAKIAEVNAYCYEHPESFKNLKLIILGSIWFNRHLGVRKSVVIATINGKSEAYLVPCDHCALREDNRVLLVKLKE